MKLYIGITKSDELVYIEYDPLEDKQQNYFSLCGGTYDTPKTEQEGEEEARKRLSTREYWEDIGLLPNGNNFLSDFIDFEEVADHVLNNDGWEMTNGEFNHFGEYEGEEIYLNSQSGGQHKEEINNFKKLFVKKEDLKKIYEYWDKYHLKEKFPKEVLTFMSAFFEKYKNLCSDQEILIKYMEFLKS